MFDLLLTNVSKILANTLRQSFSPKEDKEIIKMMFQSESPEDILGVIRPFAYNQTLFEYAKNELKSMIQSARFDSNPKYTAYKWLALESSKFMSNKTCYHKICLKRQKQLLIEIAVVHKSYEYVKLASAGQYVAYFRDFLKTAGRTPHYFSKKNNWPNFTKLPNELELNLHRKFADFTKVLTNRKIKDVSILDFVGFGSKIGQENSDWRHQLTFAFTKKHNDYARKYHEINRLWNDYETNPHAYDFPKHNHSYIFDFTREIQENLDAFIKSNRASHLGTPMSNNIFDKEIQNISKACLNPFNPSKRFHFDSDLFLSCGFNKNKKAYHKCVEFDSVLTNNGLCYAFNAELPSKTFKQSKLVRTIEKNFNLEEKEPKKFAGTGKLQGIMCTIAIDSIQQNILLFMLSI